MKITLTAQQQQACAWAALVKMSKDDESLTNGRRYNNSINYFERIAEFTESTASEWAVALYFGIEFDPFEIKYKNKADVGSRLEIKWTKYDEGSLIVHEYDRPTDIAVLVVGKAPTYRIAGWIPVSIAQRARYRHTTQPNWWISQINLQPIENLRRSNYGQAAI